MNRTKTAFVTFLRTFADELEGHCVEQVAQPEGQGQPAPTKGRERPPKAAATPPADPAEPKAPEGMSLEELQALIKPAVEAAAGVQVKALIAKHGGTSLSTLPPASHEAFKADVEGLVY